MEQWCPLYVFLYHNGNVLTNGDTSDRDKINIDMV